MDAEEEVVAIRSHSASYEEAAEEDEMWMMSMAEEMAVMNIAEEAAAIEKGEKKKKIDDRDKWLAWVDKENRALPPESLTDPNAYEARIHRENWDIHDASMYGPFELTTSIPPSCFSRHYRGFNYARPQETLQIFSVRVGEIKKPLSWPIDVFGSVAVRDRVDHNRNMVFDRKRDNCQTITNKDRNLTLTGPTRAVVASIHPTHIEVDLKVKGPTESEDEDLSYLVLASLHGGPCYRAETSKLSTLELRYVRIDLSMEATISVKVRGSWPGLRGMFTASTASFEGMEILLVEFEGNKLPVDADGNIELARCVVCVELPQPEGKLIFSAQAEYAGKENISRVRKVFTPKKAGKSEGKLELGSCEMKVSVTWSLLSGFRCDYDEVLGRG